MAHKVTNLLSTWIKIDDKLLQHGDSLVTSQISDDLKRLERLGAVRVDEVSVAGTIFEPPAPPKVKTAKIES